MSTRWTLYNGESVAEARIATDGSRSVWQLRIDNETVIGCAYTAENDREQVQALERTALAELQARGWTATRAR